MISDVIKDHPEEIINSLGVLIASYVIFNYLIYPLYFHPLSKIPGPKICALSPYWILYISWGEKRNSYVHDLHLKYGPIVRIGPNEIDISDVEYQKDIYVNNMNKTSFYTQFTNYGSFNTFSTVDKKTHRESRKVSAKYYSKSNIMSESIQTKVRSVMGKLLSLMNETQSKEINVFYLWSMMAMDAVTSFTFGENYYDPLLNDPFNHGSNIIKNFLIQSSSWFWTTQMPSLYDMFVSKSVGTATAYVCDWIEEQFNNSLKALDDPSKETLITTLLGENSKRSKTPLFDNLRAKSEIFDHIAAGHNTTATTLSYLYYELARNPKVQTKLQSELKQLHKGSFKQTTDFTSFNYEDIENLPYLNSIVNETFRIYAAIPGQEPRTTPSTGLQWRGSSTLSPTLIPGGVTVTMQPWSLHRNPQIFPNPDKWDPERWLTAGPDQLKIMNKQMMQFGSGTRMCVGMNLAVCEIKLNVCNLLVRYHVGLVDGFDYEKRAQMKDIYTTVPDEFNVPIVFKGLLA